MKDLKSIYLQLFVSFAKIGVLTFGGGPAMLPMLEKELVDKRGWTSNDELLDYYAVGQCTPGIIAVNTATFVGRKKAGIPGGIVATLGMIFPSLVIIILIAAVLSGFAENPYVKSAFAGIRVCVCVLICNAVIKLGKSALKDKATVIIAVLVTASSFFFGISPAIFVLVCAVLGILLTEFGVRGK